MSRYNYEISGDYEDLARIVVDNHLIHNGSIIGIIKKEAENTVISFNYGTKSLYTYVLRKREEYIVGIPLVTMHNNPEKYYPLVFTKDEYDDFFQKCYTDKTIAYDLQECKNEELIKMWACSYNALIFNYNTKNDIKNLYNDVVFISNNMSVDDLEVCLNNSNLKLEEHPEIKKTELITVYLDLGSVEECDCLVAVDGNIYLKLTDTFGIRTGCTV